MNATKLNIIIRRPSSMSEKTPKEYIGSEAPLNIPAIYARIREKTFDSAIMKTDQTNNRPIAMRLFLSMLRFIIAIPVQISILIVRLRLKQYVLTVLIPDESL